MPRLGRCFPTIALPAAGTGRPPDGVLYHPSMFIVGIDVGGTFTDLTAVDESTGRVVITKVPSRPRNEAAAVLDGLAALTIAPRDVRRLVHGTTVGTNAVLDPMSQLRGADASVPVAAQYPYHAITNTFRLLTAYPYARSVKPAENPANGRTPQTFIQSGRNSWAETDLALLTTRGEAQPEPDKGDIAGPVSLGVALAVPVADASTPAPKAGEDAPPKPETRIVVVGDSDFAANSVVGTAGNRDMFMNIVNWLAQQENLISVRPRNPEDRRITLTAGQDRFIFWLTVLLIPGVILLAGIQTWWRRR